MSDVLRLLSLVSLLSLLLLGETNSLPVKQLDNICFNDDKRVLPFRHCSDAYVGKLQVNNTTESSSSSSSSSSCPRHSLLFIISIHPSKNKDIAHDAGCRMNCTPVLFQNKCQPSTTTTTTTSCHFRSADVWEDLRECHVTEIRFICFNTKASQHVDEDDLRWRNISKRCSNYLHSIVVVGNNNSNLQFAAIHQENNFNVSFEMKFKVRKREIKNYTTTTRPLVVENETFTSEDYKMSTANPRVEINKTQQQHPHNNSTIQHKETFLGRQISLWFSSINEPHLIGVFIKSNLEKFILYVIVFICIGVMSVMGVVIYSLAYQIKHRRTYMVNKNNQQKPGKITYHSPNNWRTPDSGSSTGDDRTLHDEEVHAMDRTDSRHAMCSSITETRSNREENQLTSSHQPLNNNSVRGSTTLPSPPNSLIFERASPLATHEGAESPREKTTPSHADVHYTERLSS